MAHFVSGVVPLIPINRDLAVPLHRQVYSGFRDAILRGGLAPGQQVPSSRALASSLGISRFPVLDAYSQLNAEGFFESRIGAGTFIATSLRNHRRQTNRSLDAPDGTRNVSRQVALFPPYQKSPWRFGWGAFAVHQPAIDQFPFEAWSKLVARNSRRPRFHAFHHIDPLGLRPFREAVATYLSTSRAVRCDPEQIMIVSGSQQALDITARVLFNPADQVWIEEPCYPLVRSILRGSGCKIRPIPVDEEGLNVEFGIRHAGKARAAFVTPSHHYALGVTMSISRRLQLLDWARRSSAWIIEDDYDSEFRFESQPIACLQGLDTAGRVIYIGTFSKVLFPSLRLGYIVIPPDLVDSFTAVRFSMDIFPPYLFQEVLTDFMSSGHFVRHIRRMRTLYKSRREALVESLEQEFGDLIEIHGSEAGMHLSVTLPDGFDDTEIATRAANERLWLWPLSPCWTGPGARSGFILGYGNTPEEQMRVEVGRLGSSSAFSWDFEAPTRIHAAKPENHSLPVNILHPSLQMDRIAKSLLISAVCVWLGSPPNQSRAQATNDLPDAPGQMAKSAVDTTTGVPQREATWRSLPGDFLHDQKDLWTFPLRLVKGRNLVPTLLVVGGTVGLIYADPHDMPYFRRHEKNLDDVNDVFDPMITTGEVIALPAGLLAAGYIRHDDREVNTALLAAEAYGDSVVINLAMKAVTRRERPSDIAPNGDYDDTFFSGGKSPFKGSSFPSGHSTAVWSVATVVAERYRHRGKPWIPVLSYTLASAISFSRITESAHFPSDVWLGSALGFSIAKYQTLKPR